MKRFNMIDEKFKCMNCGMEVDTLNYKARYHFPRCLYSRHVDVMPGDRQNKCMGLMMPIGIEKYKNTYKIIYKCLSCGEVHKNIMAQDDDYDMIVKLSVIGN